jgi:hypothetical protein
MKFIFRFGHHEGPDEGKGSAGRGRYEASMAAGHPETLDNAARSKEFERLRPGIPDFDSAAPIPITFPAFQIVLERPR